MAEVLLTVAEVDEGADGVVVVEALVEGLAGGGVVAARRGVATLVEELVRVRRRGRLAGEGARRPRRSERRGEEDYVRKPYFRRSSHVFSRGGDDDDGAVAE
jgi:hypothetical protein